MIFLEYLETNGFSSSSLSLHSPGESFSPPSSALTNPEYEAAFDTGL